MMNQTSNCNHSQIDISIVNDHLTSDKCLCLFSAVSSTAAKNIIENIAHTLKSNGYGNLYLHFQSERHGEILSVMCIGGENDNGKLKGLAKRLLTEYDSITALLKSDHSNEIYRIIPRVNSTELVGKSSLSNLEATCSSLFSNCKLISVTMEKNWLGKLATSSNKAIPEP